MSGDDTLIDPNPSRPPLVRGGEKPLAPSSDEGRGDTPPLAKEGDEPLAPSPDKGRVGEGFDNRREGLAYLPYNPKLTALARENRKNPTTAEMRIWREVLSRRQFASYKFLRQKPIGNYIVDFYCSELRLVIEVDGDSHADSVEYDAERSRALNALGLTVARYTNGDVIANLEGVYVDLLRYVSQLC